MHSNNLWCSHTHDTDIHSNTHILHNNNKRNGQPINKYCKRNKITMLNNIKKKKRRTPVPSGLLTYYAHLIRPKPSPCLPPAHPPCPQVHTGQPIQFTSIIYSFSLWGGGEGGYGHTGKWIQENTIFMRFCCCFKLSKNTEKLLNKQPTLASAKCTLTGLVQEAKKSCWT